jgi:hypothetical protein
MQPDDQPVRRHASFLSDPLARLRFEREVAEADAHERRRRIRHLREQLSAAPRRERARITAEIEHLTAERNALLATADEITARLGAWRPAS